MKKINLSYVGMAFSIMALIIASSKIFGISIPIDIVYWFCILSLICNWAHALMQYKHYSDLYLLKWKEVMDLEYSYRGMGRYISDLKIEELNDLNLRIENEFKDIKVKKESYAKKLGINKGI